MRIAIGGGRGAEAGGGGGADGGREFRLDGGGGTNEDEEGFRELGGGMGGFLPIGGGGLGLVTGSSGVDCMLDGVGRRWLLNAETLGGRGAAAEGGKGGAPPGNRGAGGGRDGGPPPGRGGAAPFGRTGALGALLLRILVVSGSESYRLTPPPLFRSFGMPPANIPPNCGADSMPVVGLPP